MHCTSDKDRGAKKGKNRYVMLLPRCLDKELSLFPLFRHEKEVAILSGCIFVQRRPLEPRRD